MNPGQFVDRMRVEAAQQWIDSSSMGLKEIADACGFQFADSMRLTFLRVLGSAPQSMLPGSIATPDLGKKLRSEPSEGDH
jgi:transcriptional regulator GlxA family with amidase domain